MIISWHIVQLTFFYKSDRCIKADDYFSRMLAQAVVSFTFSTFVNASSHWSIIFIAMQLFSVVTLHPVHEMLTILTDIRSVSVSLSCGLNRLRHMPCTLCVRGYLVQPLRNACSLLLYILASLVWTTHRILKLHCVSKNAQRVVSYNFVKC